jgi:hypothetical protein
MCFTNQQIQDLTINVHTMFIFLYNFYNFLCYNNPTILDFTYDNDDNEETNIDDRDKPKSEKDEIVKYEDKYLDKFKVFPNTFHFTELELEQEIKEYEKIKNTFEITRTNTINECKDKLSQIDELIEKGSEQDTNAINEFGKNVILKFYNYEEMYKQHPEYVDFEELYADILTEKKTLKEKLEETTNNILTDDQMHLNAHEIILNTKFDKYINNYILEHTPLGNVYMRYNNSKKSFEYFSNNTIPYRYLEPLGRKYVMTYWCKPLFVDIEDELKKAEVKFDEEAEQKKENERKREEEIAANPKNVIARMKNYNKDAKNQATVKPQMKNRTTSNFALPPQIKANLPNVNQNSDKHLLKENANRYTWEGRLSSFCPLKKIDRKQLDKKLTMTYAEFKKMQQK